MATRVVAKIYRPLLVVIRDFDAVEKASERAERRNVPYFTLLCRFISVLYGTNEARRLQSPKFGCRETPALPRRRGLHWAAAFHCNKEAASNRNDG